jgi:hypothetical protein
VSQTRISRIEPGEASITAFDGHRIPHVRRPWSAFLSQFAEIVKLRGALPFPADSEFRTALDKLVTGVAALEGAGVRFRPAGHFALCEDLFGALVALRGDVSRAYNAALDGGGPDLIARLRSVARDLKPVLAAVKTAWPHPNVDIRISSPRKLAEDTWTVDVDGRSVLITFRQARSPLLLQRRLMELLNIVVPRDVLARALLSISPDDGTQPSL